MKLPHKCKICNKQLRRPLNVNYMYWRGDYYHPKCFNNRKKVKKKINNFIEVDTVEQANNIDLTLYTFIKFSETRQKYIFKLREKRK